MQWTRFQTHHRNCVLVKLLIIYRNLDIVFVFYMCVLLNARFDFWHCCFAMPLLLLFAHNLMCVDSATCTLTFVSYVVYLLFFFLGVALQAYVPLALLWHVNTFESLRVLIDDAFSVATQNPTLVTVDAHLFVFSFTNIFILLTVSTFDYSRHDIKIKCDSFDFASVMQSLHCCEVERHSHGCACLFTGLPGSLWSIAECWHLCTAMCSSEY